MKMEQLIVGKYENLETYSFEMPNIYQIELVGGLCNLKCPECPVTKGEVRREKHFFDIKMLEKLINKDCFKNTFYTELQMYGEPLLHPKIDLAIKILKKNKIKVGLSTNLTTWKDCLLDLDFVTISCDDTFYRNKRNEKIFMSNLKILLSNTTKTKIDLQVLKIGQWKKRLSTIKELVNKYCNNMNNILIRTNPNCFVSCFKQNIDDFCVNPFISCSIQSDGDVVPCCFEWGKELVIGNIYKESLYDIWNSIKRKKLIKKWITNNLPKKCKSCKYRSPILLHWRFWKSWITRRWL